MRAALVIALLSTSTACGQTGSLYLPDETIDTPVEIRTTDDEKKEGEDKATEPPGR